jgi:XTP/dITP diphosphohydrolase
MLVPESFRPPGAPPALLIATTNAGKFSEFAQLLAALPLRLESLSNWPGAPIVSEEGTTHAANALHKAVSIARWSGRATLADDSGLEVDALGGAPGVLSARYAGVQQDPQANLHKLLRALDGVAAVQRSARFRCVLAVACPGGATLTAEGACEGRITDMPRGSGGFGYDPVFFSPELGMTFAEAPAQQKHRVSHRARACALLAESLVAFLTAHGSGRVNDPD